MEHDPEAAAGRPGIEHMSPVGFDIPNIGSLLW